MYHAGTNFSGSGDVNYQDTRHMAMASAVPAPKDGKVRRILDIGTSIGQFATSMKRRFPEAEVWGVDIGAPMVRYAHLKAAAEGIAVNFAQRLAEDTKFPDNHFDMITSNIMHHEATADASKEIFKEVNRILRPGGLYYPIDAYTQSGPPTDPFGKFRLWWIYRWNHEDWQVEWAELDAREAMRKANLKVEDGPAVRGRESTPNYMGTKV
jgi:ubiquinone/menaquinone biosynthesis C-methylase UbiE